MIPLDENAGAGAQCRKKWAQHKQKAEENIQDILHIPVNFLRSEERRVGKECRL